MLHNLQSLPGILRVNQYGSNETFPEDVKELLMLDSDAKSCDEDESRQYQEMDEIEHDFEVTIMTLKITKTKIVTMMMTFFKIKSLIKSSTV